MKTHQHVLWAIAMLLLGGCLSGCGDRTHNLKQSTAYIGGDGETNRVVNIEFESGIRLVGQKMDLADLELTESMGKDGWEYGVNASSTSTSPQSIALQYVTDAFKSSQLAQSRQAGPAISEEDRELLREIPALRADMARITEALEASGSSE